MALSYTKFYIDTDVWHYSFKFKFRIGSIEKINTSSNITVLLMRNST